MQNRIKKDEKGITLMLLVITIIVLTLISIPVIVNFKSVKEMNRYTLFKADMDSLNEAIELAYKDTNDLSSIGPKMAAQSGYTESQEFQNVISENGNIGSDMYLISLDNLNSKLVEGAKISLNYGDLNKNYTSNPKYNESANLFTETGEITDEDAYVVDQRSKTVYYLKGITYNSKKYYTFNEKITTIHASVNAPTLSEGMIPVKYYNGTWQICSETNAEWYDYNQNTGDSSTSKWANVMLSDGRFKKTNGTIVDSANGNSTITVDSTTNYTISESDLGSMFVWIPRFAYKIQSGMNSATTGTVSVKFLQGTSNNDFDGNTISKEYPTVSSGSMNGYVVHPSFTNGTTNKYENGEWDSEITGFWVAKFPAGFQASTLKETNSVVSSEIANASDTIIYSSKHYSSNNGSIAIGTANTDNSISYPVFKIHTYAYNCINSGDMYRISKDMTNTDFYGLNNVDTHMMKNSEWGAVAYLTQSQYGRNNEEVSINNFSINDSSKMIYGVTGLYSSTVSAATNTDITTAENYDSSNGIKGSSTKNATGVYDLSGCVWQRTTGYITNGNSNLVTYGSGIAIPIADSTPNTNGISTKWTTAYPCDTTSDSSSANWAKFVASVTSAKTKYGFGDAIYETSQGGSGSNSWNGDLSEYPQTGNFEFSRAGFYGYGSNSGTFAYSNTNGSGNSNYGFRVTIINQ